MPVNEKHEDSNAKIQTLVNAWSTWKPIAMTWLLTNPHGP